MERVCFTMQVAPDRLEDYLDRHAHVWPEMLEALHASGWRNYSLFTRTDGLVIGYLETDDYAAAQRGMELTEINARWQESMAPLFAAGGSFDADPERLQEAFHLEDQLARTVSHTETVRNTEPT